MNYGETHITLTSVDSEQSTCLVRIKTCSFLQPYWTSFSSRIVSVFINEGLIHALCGGNLSLVQRVLRSIEILAVLEKNIDLRW